jgi:hypothetical protein
MSIDIHLATSEDERRAVARLRYDVYVTELARYGGRADHANRELRDPEDDVSWLFYASDGPEVIASTRLTSGTQGFSPRQIDQYGLAPFLAELEPEHLVVGERTTVRPSHRGSDALRCLLDATAGPMRDSGARVVFGACEPHLVPTYVAAGQRPYGHRNINHADAGYLIPLISFIPDVESLRGMGTAAGRLPSCVIDALGSGRATSCDGPASVLAIRAALEASGSPLTALDGTELAACLARSTLIEAAAGDRVLCTGGSAHNVYVVLAGQLEARDQGSPVGHLGPGELMGEMAFLLGAPRSVDVVATTPALLLSLSPGTLRRAMSPGTPTATVLEGALSAALLTHRA